MPTTPTVRIPYVSEREPYSSRGYTAQQLALMERQGARDTAYAHARAQRMADRWSGLGGMVTETLGGLAQARQLREAQELEQARYDAEQARLRRIEDEANRRFSTEAEWRRADTDATKEYREYQELKNWPLDVPFKPRQLYLWNKFSGRPLRTAREKAVPVFPGAGVTPEVTTGYTSLDLSDPQMAEAYARAIASGQVQPSDRRSSTQTTESMGPGNFRSEPPRMGERAFRGLFPVTSRVGAPAGGGTLADVARGTSDRGTGVDLGIGPEDRFFAPRPTPEGPLQSYRTPTVQEVQAEAERVRNQERYEEAIAARDAALADARERQAFEDARYETEAALRRQDRQLAYDWRTKAAARLPVEVSRALSGLVAQRAKNIPRDEAISAILANWDRWSAAYPDLKLKDVQDVVLRLWPRPLARGYSDIEVGNVFNADGTFKPVEMNGTGSDPSAHSTDEEVAQLLVDQGRFPTVAAALAAMRALED
jgi:hypothetical protein